MHFISKYYVLTVLFSVLILFNFHAQQAEYYAQGNDSYSPNKSKTNSFEKEIDIPFFQGSKIYWYDSLKLVRENLSLEDLETSQTENHIRIWTDKNAIDAWKDVDGKYNCVVTSFCKDYNLKSEEEGEFSQKKSKMQSITAEILIDSLYSKGISTLSDYHHVKKINKNLIDGVTYKIEISTPTSYRMFTFLNPENQNSNIKEVELFLSYLKIMSLEFDLNQTHRQFMAGLKNGTYVAGLDVITKKKGSTKLSSRND